MVTLQFVDNILVFYFFYFKSSFLCLLIWTRQQVFLETSYLLLVCHTSSKFIGTSLDDGGTYSLDLHLCHNKDLVTRFQDNFLPINTKMGRYSKLLPDPP